MIDDPIEMSLSERERLVEYVCGPFNPDASVGALAEYAEPEFDRDIEDWWAAQKQRAGVA